MIGLSGGIGSGKSTVAKIWAEEGATIIDADAVARSVVAPGEPALAEIAQQFGADVVQDDGSLNRQLLAARAFASEEQTALLNSITGSNIRQRVAELVQEAPCPELTVYDVPLLIEHDLADDFSTIVMVIADEEVRLDRLQTTRNMTLEDAQNRMSRQATDSQRRAIADIVIENNGSLDDLVDEAKRVWRYLQESCSST